MGGGHMGGMGGMSMGGMGHMGGMGMGHMGGMGFGNRGFSNRGFGGFGGIGFFPGFWGGFSYPFWGGYGGFGYPYYGGYGLGYGGYGYPYYDGYGYGYPNYGYANGYGYGNPYYATNYANPDVGVTYSSAYVAPTGSAANVVMPTQGRYLGIDEDPFVDSTGRKGMKVGNVYPGTPAQRAGLRVGDVIYSINGYLTEQRGNLAWIIANAAPDKQLKLSIKSATDGEDHVLRATLP